MSQEKDKQSVPTREGESSRSYGSTEEGSHELDIPSGAEQDSHHDHNEETTLGKIKKFFRTSRVSLEFLVLLISLALILISFLIIVSDEIQLPNRHDIPLRICHILKAWSVVVLLTMAIGAYGSYCKHQFTLSLFILFLVSEAVFFGFTLIRIVGPGEFASLDENLAQKLIQNEKSYDWTNRENQALYNEATFTWDEFQSTLKCCGALNVDEWPKEYSGRYPRSCCSDPIPNPNSTILTCDRQKIYNTPCISKIKSMVQSSTAILWFFMIMQISLAILTLRLYSRLRNNCHH